MGTYYSAALLRGWRFSYDNLLSMFNLSWENGDISEQEDEIFDMLYDCEHFYGDDLYADRDCQTFYIGSMIKENDIWGTNTPITQSTLMWGKGEKDELIRIWRSLFSTKPMPEPQIYLFPRVT